MRTNPKLRAVAEVEERERDRKERKLRKQGGVLDRNPIQGDELRALPELRRNASGALLVNAAGQ